jgi:hypothetical protein
MVNSSQPLLEISSPNKSSIMSYSPFLIPAFLTYVALCSLLRFRRRDAIQKKFNYMDKSSMSKMTNVDAQAILNQLAEFEFPKMYETSLQFALFKVQYPASIAQFEANAYVRLMGSPRSLRCWLPLGSSQTRT